MNAFFFKGEIPASKSLFNRALIVQSLFPNFTIDGHSQSEDVDDLKKNLEILKSGGSDFHIRAGGTTLRFLLARLSLITGSFKISAHARLLDRPHQELYRLLLQLGCEVVRESSQVLRVVSKGWPQHHLELEIDGEISSQFASALLLSATAHPQGAELKVLSLSSQEYFLMTVQFLQALGFRIQTRENGPYFKAHVDPISPSFRSAYRVEPDMSSAATIAAFAALHGECHITHWPQQSLQPDAKFIDVLKSCGAIVQVAGKELSVKKATSLRGAVFDFRQTPDLAPVYAVFLSLISGTSRIEGLSSLQHKESDRLFKTSELLAKMGVRHRTGAESIEIEGLSGAPSGPQTFDPDQDHRMAMAAQLAKWSQFNLEILNPEVVDKSYKEFWQVTHISSDTRSGS